MKKLIVSILILTLIGILPCLFQYGVFMIETDFASQEVPFIIETKRMLSTGAPFWSWNHYIGDNFIGSYTFYTLTSPFVWLCCLFPYEHILLGITLTLFLKMLCTGIFSYLYFRKMNLSDSLSIIGGLMYVFSSWSISNLFYYHFLEPMMCFPIFLISIETFLRKDNFGEIYLALSTFLLAFINYYFLPCSFIGGCVYALIRTTSKEIQFNLRRFVSAGIFMGFGILLASFVILPTFLQLQGSSRIGINWGLDIDGFLYAFERLRTLFAPKLLEDTNKLIAGTGWNSNAAHIPVVGVLLSFLYIKKNRDWISFLLIVFIILYITPLNGVFSLFTNPNYSRWSYVLTLFLILGSLKYLESSEKVSIRSFTLYSIVAILVIALSYGISYIIGENAVWEKLDQSTILTNIIIITLFLFNLFLLFIYCKVPTLRCLFICVCISTVVYVPTRLFMRTEGYFRLTKDCSYFGFADRYIINNELERQNHNFSYRTDFVTRRSHIYQNIAMLCNIPSIASFSSVMNTHSRELLDMADSINFSYMNLFSLNREVSAFDALMSVKYIYSIKDPLQKAIPRQDGGAIKADNVYCRIIENYNYIPMGFTYDRFIPRSEFISYINNKSGSEREPIKNMIANIVIEDKDIPSINKYLRKGHISQTLSLDSLINERKKNICTAFKGDTRGFYAEIEMQRDNLLFFSVPYDKGFTATVDGVDTNIYQVNIGLSAIFVNQGKHFIRFNYLPTGLIEGCWISLCSLIILGIFFLWSELKKQRNNNTSVYI